MLKMDMKHFIVLISLVQLCQAQSDMDMDLPITYLCDPTQLLVLYNRSDENVKMHCSLPILCGEQRACINSVGRSCDEKSQYLAGVEEMPDGGIRSTCCKITPAFDGEETCYNSDIFDPNQVENYKPNISLITTTQTSIVVITRAPVGQLYYPTLLPPKPPEPTTEEAKVHLMLFDLKESHAPEEFIKAVERIPNGYRIKICKPHCSPSSRGVTSVAKEDTQSTRSVTDIKTKATEQRDDAHGVIKINSTGISTIIPTEENSKSTKSYTIFGTEATEQHDDSFGIIVSDKQGQRRRVLGSAYCKNGIGQCDRGCQAIFASSLITVSSACVSSTELGFAVIDRNSAKKDENHNETKQCICTEQKKGSGDQQVAGSPSASVTSPSTTSPHFSSTAPSTPSSLPVTPSPPLPGPPLQSTPLTPPLTPLPSPSPTSSSYSTPTPLTSASSSLSYQSSQSSQSPPTLPQSQSTLSQPLQVSTPSPQLSSPPLPSPTISPLALSTFSSPFPLSSLSFLHPLLPTTSPQTPQAPIVSSSSPISVAQNQINQVQIPQPNPVLPLLVANNASGSLSPNSSLKQQMAERNGCFSSEMTVRTKEGRKRMDELHVGDKVLVISSQSQEIFQPIEWFYHRDADHVIEFITLELKSGRYLSLTPNHLIPFVKCDAEFINLEEMDKIVESSTFFASRARVGLCVASHFDESNFRADQIVTVKREHRRGVFSPITKHGTIVVNGVQTSCYSSFENQAVQQAIHSVLIRANKILQAIENWLRGGPSDKGDKVIMEDKEIPSVLAFLLGLAKTVLPLHVYV